MRIAFFPYDILILFSFTFLFGIILKSTLFKNRSFQNWQDKLFLYSFAFLPISIAFLLIFDEFPIKFFSYNHDLKEGTSKMAPQGMPIDEVRLLAFVYNCMVWLACIIIIIRYFFFRKINSDSRNKI